MSINITQTFKLTSSSLSLSGNICLTCNDWSSYLSDKYYTQLHMHNIQSISIIRCKFQEFLFILYFFLQMWGSDLFFSPHFFYLRIKYISPFSFNVSGKTHYFVFFLQIWDSDLIPHLIFDIRIRYNPLLFF